MKVFVFLVSMVLPFTFFSQSQRKKEVEFINDTVYTIVYGKDIRSSDYNATDKVEEGKLYHLKKEGSWTTYFKTGKIKLIAEYKNGVPRGKFLKFYENGKLREKGVFLDNHFSDTLFRYYQNGNLESIVVYNEKGEENGTNKYFHDNGNVALVYEKQDNQISDKISWYKEDGALKHQVETTPFGKIKPLFENESSFAFDNSLVKKKVYSLRIAGPITKDSLFNPNGYNIVYTKHDEIYQIGQFSEGSLVDGKSYQYDENGLLDKILVYKTGKFISYAQINKK
jgi:antitoxin component YwqK of YwqJK toxin-antitoxin module